MSRRLTQAAILFIVAFADHHFMTLYGELSQPLLDLPKAHAAGFTWFTFVQGLKPSPMSHSRHSEVTREAEQPV